MKKLIVLLLFYSILSLNAQSLKVFYGHQLFYQSEDNLSKIKVLNVNGYFVGYELIDSMRIFLAYYPGTDAEASTVISIFDIQNGNEILIEQIGGTGESIFQYNKKSGCILFNWDNGIHLFKILDKNGNVNKKFETIKLVEGYCFLPYWVNEDTIGYQIFENEAWVKKYYTIE